MKTKLWITTIISRILLVLAMTCPLWVTAAESVQDLWLKVKNQDAEAAFVLGCKYYFGDDVEKDYQKAIPLFNNSIKWGRDPSLPNMFINQIKAKSDSVQRLTNQVNIVANQSRELIPINSSTNETDTESAKIAYENISIVIGKLNALDDDANQKITFIKNKCTKSQWNTAAEEAVKIMKNFVDSAIDISKKGCPKDFVDAYESYIDSYSKYIAEFENHPTFDGISTLFIKSLSRAANGDFSGPTKEENESKEWQQRLLHAETACDQARIIMTRTANKYRDSQP